MPNWICEQNHANLWVILWRPERKQPNLVPLVPMYSLHMTRINLYQPFFLSHGSWVEMGARFHQTLGGDLKAQNMCWKNSPGKKHQWSLRPFDQNMMATFIEVHGKKSSSTQVVLLVNIIISIANLNWYLRNHLRCLRSSHRAARSHPLMVSRMYISTSDCGPWMWKAESWMEPRSAPNKTRCIWCIYLHLDHINYRNVGKYM